MSQNSPCRDCGAPAPSSARACPHCGILNPVLQWVAYPDGSHLTAREPAGSGLRQAVLAPQPAYAPVDGAAARALLPPPPRVRFAGIAGPPKAIPDRLADWAIWSMLFVTINILFIGGLIGGLIAALVTIPIRKAIPVRPDGRQLPAALSWAMIGTAVLVYLARIYVVVTAAA